MYNLAKIMTSILMILFCLFGYFAVIVGTLFVAKTAMKELFNIDILKRWER